MIERNSRKYRCPIEMDSVFTDMRSNLTLLRAAAHLNYGINLSMVHYFLPLAIVIGGHTLRSCQRETKKLNHG
jgi:hypothetical protein